MSVANEWYAVEVSGTVTELTGNLNALEKQGWDVFSVVISPRGWTVIASRPLPEEKTLDEKPAEKPEPSRRGTVVLHKGQKK